MSAQFRVVWALLGRPNTLGRRDLERVFDTREEAVASSDGDESRVLECKYHEGVKHAGSK